MTDYIVCYDISDPRRLARVHRALKRQATPIQYSVFLLQGTERQLQDCLQKIELLIDRHTDDVRAYPLPQRGLRLSLGPSVMPGGTLWSELPAQWHAADE